METTSAAQPHTELSKALPVPRSNPLRIKMQVADQSGMWDYRGVSGQRVRPPPRGLRAGAYPSVSFTLGRRVRTPPAKSDNLESMRKDSKH